MYLNKNILRRQIFGILTKSQLKSLRCVVNRHQIDKKYIHYPLPTLYVINAIVVI